MSVELHVAAMPFPTRQGTQAVVHAMSSASHRAERRPHLLTYGEGEGRPTMPYTWHRAARVSGRANLRSGPSTRKLVQDLALVPAIKRVCRRLEPRVIVAHHVEAALACMAAGVAPLVFFAHTGLGPELPTYARPELGALLGRAGRALDAMLCRRADAVCAISPSLADDLAQESEREVAYVPAPWPVPAPATADERQSGRAAIGLARGDRALLYAGNLDAYQGWEDLVAAMAKLRRSERRARLVVATASDGAPLRRAAAEADISSALKIVDLPDTEPGRRALYAAADLAIIPRRTPGGLPIKLLDALGRGLPTVAARRAAAGLPLASAAHLTNDDDAAALAAACRVVLDAPEAAAELGRRGRAYVEDAHGGDRYVAALDAVARSAQRVSRNATRSPISSLLR